MVKLVSIIEMIVCSVCFLLVPLFPGSAFSESVSTDDIFYVKEIEIVSKNKALEDIIEYKKDKILSQCKKTNLRANRIASFIVDLSYIYYFEKSRDVLDCIEFLVSAALNDYPNNNDIFESHLIASFSICYSCCNVSLKSQTLEMMRSSIYEYVIKTSKTIEERGAWWAKNYLQNHNYLNFMAFTHAIVLFREDPRYGYWISQVTNNLKSLMEYLSHDGSCHEGVSYCSLGVYALTRTLLLLEQFNVDVDFFVNSKFYTNYYEFRASLYTPDLKTSVPFGDSFGYDFRKSYLYLYHLLSHELLSNEYLKFYCNVEGRDWLDMDWLDIASAMCLFKIESCDFSVLRNSYYDNLGIYTLRSGWGNTDLFLFTKAGPYLGRLAFEKKYFRGKSHVHPDNGSYLIYKGKWIVVDDGYVDDKKSINHNVILVDNLGLQGDNPDKKNLDENEMIYVNPKYNFIIEKNDINLFQQDLTTSLKQSLNVEHYFRTYIFDKTSIFVLDDISFKDEHEIRSYIHFVDDISVDNTTISFSSGKLYIESDIDISIKKEIHTIERKSAPGMSCEGTSVPAICVYAKGKKAKIYYVYLFNGSTPPDTFIDGECISVDFAGEKIKICADMYSVE